MTTAQYLQNLKPETIEALRKKNRENHLAYPQRISPTEAFHQQWGTILAREVKNIHDLEENQKPRRHLPTLALDWLP